MEKDIERLNESKKIINKIANGINPINDTPIKDECFVNDPKIIRSLFFLVDLLDSELTTKLPLRRGSFRISAEQKKLVKLPVGNIGINEFAKAINDVIDTNKYKKISGANINKKLKLMEILGEIKTPEGKTRSIPNEKSDGYGIISEVRFYNNEQYEQVLFNDIGKKFLLDNIEKILAYNEG